VDDILRGFEQHTHVVHELEQLVHNTERTHAISDTKLRNEIRTLKTQLAGERQIKVEALGRIDELKAAAADVDAGGYQLQQGRMSRSTRPQSAPIRRGRSAANTFGQEGYQVRPGSASWSSRATSAAHPTQTRPASAPRARTGSGARPGSAPRIRSRPGSASMQPCGVDDQEHLGYGDDDVIEVAEIDDRHAGLDAQGGYHSPELMIRSRPRSETQRGAESPIAHEHTRRLKPHELPKRGRTGFGTATPRPTFGNFLPP
jgi:hypothetical protein